MYRLIHAFFFITTRFQHTRSDDPSSNSANGGHGGAFLLLADTINAHGGYRITVYHSFHDEVDHFRQHIWKCNGPCQEKSPYFGIVKRSMNRPPGKSDMWWAKHERECGGQYSKIAEPEKKKAPQKKREKQKESKPTPPTEDVGNLDSWISTSGSTSTPAAEPQNQSRPKRKLGEIDDPIVLDEDDDDRPPPQKLVIVECPVCCFPITEDEVNRHLDEVHFV